MEEEEYDFGTGLTVITIVIDNTEDAPRIDLDDCPPHIAAAIFEKAAIALKAVIPYPTITFMGEMLVSDIMLDDWDDLDQ